jgi:Zn finger protein HypA/HybF involved in hydrogenase expression
MVKQQWWCLHCNRAIHTPNRDEEYKGVLECPFCGAGHMDLWKWESVSKLGKYLEISEDGKLYPQSW